jgi:hypothetical protein
MAERRMFTKKITDADAFTSMPSSAQALYFHLNMNADDDGFCNKINLCMVNAKASSDDFKLLLLKRFIFQFESGVIVVKHWRMHNILRKDRYTETDYLEEKSRLFLKDNGAYTLDAEQGETALATKWQPNGNQMAPQDRIGKDSIGNSISNTGVLLPGAVANSGKNEAEREPVFITFPLNTGEEYPITVSIVEKLKPIYPAVNIEQEIRKMQGWLLGNPTKRKTQRGVMRFVTNWLASAQDKGQPPGSPAPLSKPQPKEPAYKSREYSKGELDKAFPDIYNFDNLDDI